MKAYSNYKLHYKSNHAQFDFKESIIDQTETITKLIKSDPKREHQSHPNQKEHQG